MSRIRVLKNPRVLAGATFVAALLAVGLWPAAVAVDLAGVTRGPLLVTVDEEGETRVHDRFVVSAPVAGRVQRIELEPGDAVKRGSSVVASVLPGDPVPLDARSRAEAEAAAAAARSDVGRARAERQRAAAALAFARSELERQRDLADRKIASRQQLDSAQTQAREAQQAFEAAEFAAAAAEHNLTLAEARLMQGGGGAPPGRAILIRSPIDGVVLKRLRESEAVVPAGDPLVELGDPRQLEIVSDLLSTDAVKVKAGAAALIEQWGGDHTIRGRVRRVEPSGFMKISALGVEEQRVNVIVDFEDPLEAWKALGDGYRVEVRVVVWEGKDVLRVPTSALFRRGESWAVFAIEGGRARLRGVEIGARNSLHAELRSGLGEGARVVVHPSDALSDGARVVERQ